MFLVSPAKMAEWSNPVGVIEYVAPPAGTLAARPLTMSADGIVHHARPYVPAGSSKGASDFERLSVTSWYEATVSDFAARQVHPAARPDFFVRLASGEAGVRASLGTQPKVHVWRFNKALISPEHPQGVPVKVELRSDWRATEATRRMVFQAACESNRALGIGLCPEDDPIQALIAVASFLTAAVTVGIPALGAIGGAGGAAASSAALGAIGETTGGLLGGSAATSVPVVGGGALGGLETILETVSDLAEVVSSVSGGSPPQAPALGPPVFQNLPAPAIVESTSNVVPIVLGVAGLLLVIGATRQ